MHWVAPAEKYATKTLWIWLLESGALGLIIPTYFLPARYAIRPGRGYYF
jgi:hypothetical protein